MTNNVPKKARAVFSGPPKTRSRNGCLTCRKRKKKCDEKGPVCSGCERNYIKCVWPDHIKSKVDPPVIAIKVEDGVGPLLIDTSDIPTELCGVFEIQNYKHEKASDLIENVISLSDRKIYDDLLSYKPKSKLLLPIEEADSFKDLLFPNNTTSSSCGGDVSLMGKRETIKLTWESLAIQIITFAENKLSLCTRSIVKEFNIEDLNKNLLNEFLFNYPMLLFFQPSLDIPSPFETFEIYNGDYNSILESKDNKWFNQVLETSIFQIFECFAKLTWLIKKTDDERIKLIESLKMDVSSIWTTIQTIEIQLDNTNEDTTNGDNTLRSLGLNTPQPIEQQNHLIEFAKLAYMALQIIYLKCSDKEVDNNTPIIGFYIDQFIRSYENYLAIENSSIPKFMFIFPLIVSACASQTLSQREFISKELYLISYDLKMPFIEKVVSDIEESWGLDFNGGTQNTFNKLINGF